MRLPTQTFPGARTDLALTSSGHLSGKRSWAVTNKTFSVQAQQLGLYENQHRLRVCDRQLPKLLASVEKFEQRRIRRGSRI